MEDAFDNTAVSDYVKSFTWPATGSVVEDLAAPRLDRVCITAGGKIEIEFSEETSPVLAADAIQLGGESVVWVADPDGYVLRTLDPLASGSHQLTLGTGPLDLSGQGLAAGYSEILVVTEPATESVVYSAPFPGFVAASAVGNDFGFHGW